jgi:DNA adenine methylase
MSEMIKPIIKWPGGKRWLARKIAPLLKNEFVKYIEPFFGGGALFFAIKPLKGIVSDINEDLILCYRAIRVNAESVLLEWQKLEPNKDEYYRIRDNWFPENKYKKAARLIYLLRHSWNGLYRVNRKGDFNVPFNSRTRKDTITIDYLKEVQSILRRTKILNSDFEVSVKLAGEGDLIFADPPYFANGREGFSKYNTIAFTDEDQERLSSSLKMSERRGAAWILTNGCRKKILNYYSDYEIFIIPRKQVIAANSMYRKTISEYLVLSNSKQLKKLRQNLRDNFKLLS